MNKTISEIDLRLIRTFLTVAETGGISAAQSALNITQPSISAQLATLETHVGFRLCERGRSGFSVTPKGHRFVEAARRLIAASESFQIEVQHINRKVSGNINIGMLGQIDPADTKKIALTVSRLRSQHENLYFRFVELSSALLEEKLINGQIDVAIGYFWHRVPNIDYFPLFEETQIAYCALSHPLFEKAGDLTRKNVSEYDWVWASHPLPEMPALTSPENLKVLTDSMDSAALFILSGQHLGFLPKHYAAKYETLEELRPLNSKTLRYQARFQVAVRHSVVHGDLVDAFLRELLSNFS